MIVPILGAIVPILGATVKVASSSLAALCIRVRCFREKNGNPLSARLPDLNGERSGDDAALMRQVNGGSLTDGARSNTYFIRNKSSYLQQTYILCDFLQSDVGNSTDGGVFRLVPPPTGYPHEAVLVVPRDSLKHHRDHANAITLAQHIPSKGI